MKITHSFMYDGYRVRLFKRTTPDAPWQLRITRHRKQTWRSLQTADVALAEIRAGEYLANLGPPEARKPKVLIDWAGIRNLRVEDATTWEAPRRALVLAELRRISAHIAALIAALQEKVPSLPGLNQKTGKWELALTHRGRTYILTKRDQTEAAPWLLQFRHAHKRYFHSTRTHETVASLESSKAFIDGVLFGPKNTSTAAAVNT